MDEHPTRKGEKMITSLRWSYTARTAPRPEQDAIVVCSLSLSRLGVDRLAEEVGELCGMAEARRWHRSRAEELGARLLDALGTHLPCAEVIVHVDDQDHPERVRVLMSEDTYPERASELADRVEAIRGRTCAAWREGLQLTLTSLRRLDEPAGRTAAGNVSGKAA